MRGNLKAAGWLATIAATALCVIPATVSAAPPANDTWSEISPVLGSPSGSVTVDTTEATAEAGEPELALAGHGASVWYRYAVDVSQPITIDACDSDFDTVVAVFTGGTSVSNLTHVASDDDGCAGGAGVPSRVTFQAQAGTVYSIMVGGFKFNDDADTGNVQLDIGPATPPVNDDLTNAVELDELQGGVFASAGSNFLADKEVSEPNHAGDDGGASIWFRWTAPEDGTAVASTCTTDFDTILGVYVAAGFPVTTTIASNDDDQDETCDDADVGIGETSMTDEFGVVGGQEYKIAVDGYNNGSGAKVGNVRVVIEFEEEEEPVDPPGNDNIGSAEALSGLSDTAGGTLAGATPQAGEPDHLPAGKFGDFPTRSVWYIWTAPQTGAATIDTCTATNADTVLAAYRGGGGGFAGMTQLGSADDQCSGTGSRLEFPATAGTEYRIAVDGYDGGTFTLALNLVPTNEPPPGDTTPPETTITKAPKKKVTKKPVTIEFSSNEAGSTFQCSLNGKAFGSCSSPFKGKSKKGKNTFAVRATDAAGNVDGSPAQVSWKYKKKKRK